MSDETNTEETKAEEAQAQEATAVEIKDGSRDDEIKTSEGVKDRLKFFFSDANIRQDFFIRKLLTKDAKKVPIEVLLRFNTIKKFTTKPAVLVKAAKELSKLLTIDGDESAIGRVVPFTDALMDQNIPKSLYVRKLPMTNSQNGSPQKYAVTVDDLRKEFEKYGEIALIKFRWSSSKDGLGDVDLIGQKKRQKQKFPVGCAMVEFEKEEDLKMAAEATLTFQSREKQQPKDKIIVGGREVEVLLLSEYIEMRKKAKAAEEKENSSSSKRKHETDDIENEIPSYTIDWKPKCVIQLKGLPETCDREAILDTIATGLEISVDEVKARNIYADFSRGQKNGAIRFAEFGDEIAKMAERLRDGELKVQDTKVEGAKVLDGDEEQKYWDDFIAFKTKQIRQHTQEKRIRKKQKRGGRKY